MPHSSGGGSSSGRSSSNISCSHDSVSSHSSHNNRDNNDSTSSYIISPTPFRDARAFIYTYKGQDYTIYSNTDLTLKKKDWASIIIPAIFMVMFLGMLLFAFFVTLFTAFSIQKPIPGAEVQSIIIEDNIGVISDVDKLKESLIAFQKKTGVIPAIYTVYNEDWQENYSNAFFDYTYNVYTENFQDERHWVIIYSRPKYPIENYNNWYWHGVIGDDTDNAVPQNNIEKFNSVFQEKLLADSKDVGSSLTDAFDTLTSSIKKINPSEPENLIFSAASILVFFIFCFIIKKSWKDSPKYFNKNANLREVPFESESMFKETKSSLAVTCSYCGNKYTVSRSNGRCPQCGAIEYSWDLLRNNYNSNC